jgi:GGDEF domain-containing protein
VEALSLFFVAQEPARIGASAGVLVTELAAVATAGTASLPEQVARALYAVKRAGGGRWQWSGDEPVVMDQAV